MAAKKIQTVLLTAVFVAALLVSAFAVLDAPIYLPYSEGLVAAEPVGDGGLRITFGEEVTECDYTIYPDPEGGSFYYCDVQAWTSLWDRWLSDRSGKLSCMVSPSEPYPVKAVYVPNDGSETVCFYGDTDYEGSIVLPRLSLGYYLFLAAAHCIVSGFGTTSYSLPRDFFLIVFLSLLLYGGLLLAYGIWRLRQEMKEINQ